MNNNYYTQTSNFISATSNDVDPRTRLFGLQHSLGKITGNDGMGPDLNFTITYSPTTSTDPFLLGTGFLFAFDYYDKNSLTLMLNSGESYKTNENININDNYFEIMQYKMISTLVEKLDANNYRIINRNGEITELQDIGNGLCTPVKIYSPLGYFLSLSWDYDNYSRPYLSSVIDNNGDELYSSTYDENNAGLSMTFWPDKTESYSLAFSTGNGYLNTIYCSALPDSAYWSFGYKDVGVSGLLTLTRIQTPTGLIKEVSYNNDLSTGLMLFPDEAGLDPLPAVTKLTVSPGQGQGQPDIVTLYAPTEDYFPNYLGYGGQLGAAWNPDSDALYGLLDQDYQYQTTVTHPVDEGSEAVTVYTYNNYHLLLSTETTQGTTTHRTDMEYYALPGENFENQPTQFQYPKQQAETWSDTSLPSDKQERSEITLFEYDENGNLLSQTAPDGTVMTYVYYPAEGETSTDSSYYSVNIDYKMTGCPADPNGFTKWLKYQITTPPIVDGYTDLLPQITLYRYGSQEPLSNSPVTLAVLPLQETSTECLQDDQTITVDVPPLQTREINSYETDSASPFFGRITSIYETFYAKDANTYTQVRDHAYRIADDNDLSVNDSRPAEESYVEEVTTTSYDGYSITTSERYSCFTHQVWSSIDDLGNKTDSYYDALGRIIGQTRHDDDSEYRVSSATSYTLAPDTDGIYTESEDNNGNISREYFDGMGRPIRLSVNGIDYDQEDVWYDISTTEYDCWGRVSEQEIADYYYSDDKIDTSSFTSKLHFDDWGRLSQVDYSGLKSSYQSYDPINQRQMETQRVPSGSLKLGWQQTDYNAQGLPVTSTLLDQNQQYYSQTQNEYDGLKRLRKYTDELEHVTQYTYDAFNRLLTKTLPDGTALSWEYDPSTSASLQTRVKITYVDEQGVSQQVEMGTQTFDGLGRMTQSSCGGRIENYGYDDSNTVPSWAEDAKQQVLYYGYIPQLDNALATTSDNQDVSASAWVQNFTYQNTTGLLLSASESNSQSEVREWWPSGKIKQQTFTPASAITRESTNDWSLLGKLQNYDDIGGNQQTVTYDTFGRPWILDDPQASMTLHYDDAGRLQTQTVEDKNSSDSITITLELDDFDRETLRTIQTSNNDTLVIKHSYYLNNQLNTREVLQGDNRLRLESFIYDNRNRLQQYTCEGSELPQDAYGQQIVALDFSPDPNTYPGALALDAFSNIHTCVTTLADGNVDIATFEYTNSDDPTQLMAVSHTLTTHYPERIELKYDDNGRMILDEAGRTLTYDLAGRLTNVSGTDGNSVYAYDSFDQLVMQSLNDNDTRELYYHGDRLVNELHVEQQQHSRFIPGLSGVAAVSDETLE
ncbi:hypothetical protein M5U04_06685 [Xenorhabdus sp. XENO-1]|uniref:RHS repeat protein n=1 Tax=Xenorhabdus bovienii TaxID=40576 RepID=UPI0020CA9591|nr:RHS repeat protein [Xenorhabdus bovienii]MCP9267796.1 hypothetical protein [Xenorhabdus bovienii subsp. africana]